jgi:hypothetical protein
MTKTHVGSRIAVTILFSLLYLAFLLETGFLLGEFSASGLALRLASLDSQNFIFFPVAGLLALVAFWQPAVLLVDAMWRGQLKYGRIVLGASLLVALIGAWLISDAFESSEARSVFEIAPKALAADHGVPASEQTPPIAPVKEVLARMRILSGVDRGLGEYQAQCDQEWLRYSVAADAALLCFPAGERMSIRDCCTAKAEFRQRLNKLAAQSPSVTGAVHRWVMPVKVFFLLLLLGMDLFEGAHLDLADAFAADVELGREILQRDRIVAQAAGLEDAPFALVEHAERALSMARRVSSSSCSTSMSSWLSESSTSQSCHWPDSPSLP